MRTRELRTALEAALIVPSRYITRAELVHLLGKLERAETSLRQVRREADLIVRQIQSDPYRQAALLRKAEEANAKRANVGV